jgi:hypothetical protein
MGTATNTKTWVIDSNNEINTGDASDDNATALLALKDFLVAAGGVVRRSSDASSVSDSDLWTDISKIVWTITGARSWIVIRLDTAVFGPSLDLLIECKWGSTVYVGSLVVSITPEGYDISTGTTSAVPSTITGTAAALEPYGSGTYNSVFLPKTTVKKIWNSAKSDDGECMRFWVMSASVCCTYIEFSKYKNPGSTLAEDDQWYACWYGNNEASAANAATYVKMYTNSEAYFCGYIKGTSAYTLNTSGECTNANTSPAPNIYVAVPNPQDDDAYPLLPIGLWSESNTSYAYGRHGEMFDIWWAPSNLTNGSTFPADGSKTYIELGNCIVVPWDGSSPVIA